MFTGPVCFADVVVAVLFLDGVGACLSMYISFSFMKPSLFLCIILCDYISRPA